MVSPSASQSSGASGGSSAAHPQRCYLAPPSAIASGLPPDRGRAFHPPPPSDAEHHHGTPCHAFVHDGGAADAAPDEQGPSPRAALGTPSGPLFSNLPSARAPLFGDTQIHVPVACGSLEGVLLLPKKRIVVRSKGGPACEVTPTDFEKMAGKGTHRRWRQSIRVMVGESGEGAHGDAWGLGLSAWGGAEV